MKTSLDKDQPDFLEMQCWEGCGQHHPLPAREGILQNKPQYFQSYTMDDPITSTWGCRSYSEGQGTFSV